MNYDEILKELQEVNLKDKFISEFEDYVNPELLDMIKKNNKIKSTASLIRTLLKKWENESEEWLYWQKVLFYFMTPRFARDKNNLPK
jgi:hypothetical protein